MKRFEFEGRTLYTFETSQAAAEADLTGMAPDTIIGNHGIWDERLQMHLWYFFDPITGNDYVTALPLDHAGRAAREAAEAFTRQVDDEG